MDMDAKVKILVYLIDNRTESFTIRVVADALKLNYRTAYDNMMALQEEKSVSIDRVGNAKLCRFAGRLTPSVMISEMIRREKILRKKPLCVLYRRISEVKDPFYTLLVFGSYASGSETKKSDIDLCLICDNPDTVSRIGSFVKMMSVDVHFLHFSSSEFRSMVQSKLNNVGNEIAKNNVILYGIENYYGLIGNA